ncbi:MAG: biotin/lipoyl-binding protein [Anaerolineae bacterium]|nr:biotin/lipoyl-binding protein [Anaerolineae bacterium]MCB9129584.1 biotin/lipoyl-binding protein [Anaerolineales bacterium]MCB0228410.1 biotin/lipoyl-binding protein [Anaerolineae bacterium]MCB0233831.1 biotin/lipoyl-binding protein [Anaerolineae bacterium]MCB0249753.1 biotin/lipoyl-binding protein [Anaerolineae bacterium]
MTMVTVTVDGQQFQVDVTSSLTHNDDLTVICKGQLRHVSVSSIESVEQIEWVVIDGRPYEVVVDPNLRWIKVFDGLHQIEVQDRSISLARPVSGDGRVKAPIPGLVVRLCVELGDEVAVGEPLLVLEAMKMENEILAPRSGKVTELNVSEGTSVKLGDLLVEIS